MKLEINKRGNKEYYDEFLYLTFNYKKIRNNPHKKIKRLTMSGYSYFGISFILSLLLFILYILKKDNLYLYLTVFFLILMIISVFYIMMILTKIKKSRNIEGTNIFEITNSFIRIESSGKELKLNWDEIKYIIFGKNTISFIPNNISKPFITTNIMYKEEIIKTLKEYKKEELIIYN